MTTIKTIGTLIAGVVVGLLLGATMAGESLGGVYSLTEQVFEDVVINEDLTVAGDTAIAGTVTALEDSESITADNTITVAESGKTFYVNTNYSTSTLPAVADAAGAVYKFVIASAVSTNDFRVVSAEGDNIEGSLIVAGAVVDCDAADRVNFVTDGENLGDFVEVRSNGTKWYVTQSNALTTAKLTCSG